MNLYAATVVALWAALSSLPTQAGNCAPGMDRAIVMSGGGTKGAFEAGAVYHLVVHRRCDFKDFAGVSAGALNSAVLAQAAADSNSWDNLQRKSEDLVAIWSSIQDQRDFMRPRVLFEGLSIGALVFGTESIFVFEPLAGLIDRYVDPKLYAGQCGRGPSPDNCRALRVGAVDFYTGSYAEFAPTQDSLFGLGPDAADESQRAAFASTYKRYILASATIPVFGDMPSINQPGDEPFGTKPWRQFADGGLRHATPLPGYFPSPNVRTFMQQLEMRLRATSVEAKSAGNDKPNTSPGVIPPHPQVSELFVILANPYDQKSDTEVYDDCAGEKKPRPLHLDHAFDITGGPDILGRTLDLVLNTSGRWDINYAIIANNMLTWREVTYRAASLNPAQQNVLDKEFPVTSYNRASDPTIGTHYSMTLISPVCNLTQSTYQFTKENIALQLYAGCMAANVAFGGDMATECRVKFPDGAALAPKQLR